MPILESVKEVNFCKEKIQQHVEKIISKDPFFNSDILKRFLIFIVEEKMAGRANCLKEYTIGLNILNKPKTFKPQENGIVRIHAGRLRNALDQYYNSSGLMDEIRIFLPKGKYIPFFIRNNDCIPNTEIERDIPEQEHLLTNRNRVTVSVVPFKKVNESCVLKQFSEGLRIQLTTALSNIKYVSVTSFNMAGFISEKLAGMVEIAEVLDVQYIFTGYIQCEKNKARITIELFRTDNSEQVWSKMFEKKIIEEKLFQIQDEIIAQVMHEMLKPGNPLTGNRKKDSILAIA